jgi:hypothetical protein
MYIDETSFDELSLWSTNLNQSHINELYNNRNGINFSTTYANSLLGGGGAGSNITSYTYYDLCIGASTLCHEYTYTNATGWNCPLAKTENCAIECSDTAYYWESLNMSPASMNYSGNCSAFLFQCQNLNERSCRGTTQYASQCTAVESGNWEWLLVDTCGITESCVNGYCESILNSTGGTGTGQGDWLSGAGLTTGMKYLLVIFVIIFTIIGFGVFGATQSHIGLGFIVGIVIGAFELIIFTILGWIPVWVMIFLLLIAIATSILMSRISGGNGPG